MQHCHLLLDDDTDDYDVLAWAQTIMMTRMTIRRIIMIMMTLMILTLLRGRRREANYEEIRPRGFAGSL